MVVRNIIMTIVRYVHPMEDIEGVDFVILDI